MAVVDTKPDATSLLSALGERPKHNSTLLSNKTFLLPQNLLFLRPVYIERLKLQMYLMMLLMLLKLGTELAKVVEGADKLSIPTLWLRPPRGWLLYDGIAFPDGADGLLLTEPELAEEGELRTAEP